MTMSESFRGRIEQDVSERLSPRRYEHSVGVAETAVLLATIYGVDPAEAWVAGILHDWDKELSPQELVEAGKRYGVALDYDDSATDPVLHAFTGAHSVREAYPELSEDVIAAIARHTVADTRMSALDCVVYVADAMEPGRMDRRADTLREAAGTVSLEQLFLLAYRQSLVKLIESGRPLYPECARIFNTALRGVSG